jgi:hypothetical protein
MSVSETVGLKQDASSLRSLEDLLDMVTHPRLASVVPLYSVAL